MIPPPWLFQLCFTAATATSRLCLNIPRTASRNKSGRRWVACPGARCDGDEGLVEINHSIGSPQSVIAADSVSLSHAGPAF